MGAANTATAPDYQYDYGPWPIEDAEMEKAKTKCLDACKKVRKGNNSFKEDRKQLCKAFGLKSLYMTGWMWLMAQSGVPVMDDPPGQ